MSKNEERLWSISEIADWLKLETVMVEGLVTRGELRAVDPAGGRTVLNSELEKFIAGRRIIR